MANHVTIKETQAQRIAIGESSRATKIDVYLDEVEEGVEFNYLVYNRQKVTVSEEMSDIDERKISAMIQAGAPVIKGTEQETVNQPNQLVYTLDGKQHKLMLDNIQYQPTKITGN